MKLGDAGFLLAEKPEGGAQVSMLTRWSLPSDAGPDYVRDLVAHWSRCRDFASPFNLRLKPGLLPSWETLSPDQIDLDYHLFHSGLPKPGGERELGILASRLQSLPLDRRRPLWEMHVIEGLENDEFALFFKLHHSQIDGMGAIRLLERVLSPSPDERGRPAFWEVPPKPAESTDGSGDGSGLRLPRLSDVRKVADAAKLTRTVIDLQTSRDPGNAPAFSSPKTILNGRLQAPRRVATQCFEVDRLARLAKKAGVSLNDVVLAICSGALRRYLSERAELPDRSLTAGVPVSMRADENVGNAISFIIAKLHTEIADPLERLRAIHHSTTLAKDRFKNLPSRMTQEALGTLVMGPYIGQVALNLAGRSTPVYNLVISNVPGPREHLYLNGARMEVFYPISMIFDGQALNITFLSYAGRYAACFTACRDTVPSMQRIAVATGEALDELERAVDAHAGDRPAPLGKV
jgi:diacylglycerol O-acyltransferase / wax synthase